MFVLIGVGLFITGALFGVIIMCVAIVSRDNLDEDK